MARKKVQDDTVEVAVATSTAKVSEDSNKLSSRTLSCIRMVRSTKPFTADVHPDEVENWKQGGWRVEK